MTRQMKDSGVEWIGEIPENWKLSKVKCLYKLQTGFTPSTNHHEYYSYDESGFDWVTIADLTNAHYIPTTTKAKISNTYVGEFKPRITPKGSLLYSFKLSVGVVAIADREVYTNEAIASFIPSPDVNLNFLYYSSSMIVENAHENIYGAKILNQDLIKNALILFPPLSEQKKIASFLDDKCNAIDEIIAKTEQSIEEYKKLKQSVITEAVTKGIRPNRKMKDSGVEWIGDIPENYSLMPLKYIAEYNKETLPETTDPLYEFDYIDIGSVTYSKGIENVQTMKFKDAPTRARRVVYKDDVILSTVRTYLKATAQIMARNNSIIVSTGFITLTAIKNKVSPAYLKYAIQLDAFISEVESKSEGISYPAINPTEVMIIKAIVPPREEQKEIADYLDKKCAEIDDLIEKKQQFLTELATYKKSLIYEYVTGKKEVV